MLGKIAGVKDMTNIMSAFGMQIVVNNQTNIA